MTKTTETAKDAVVTTVKGFKASSEVEAFYRFIHDNKLRAEAHTLVKVVLSSINSSKKKSRKSLQ